MPIPLRQLSRVGIHACSSADVRASGFYVDCVEGLSGGHEETVAFGSAEADIRADFGQLDDSDALARGREDVYAIVARAHPSGSYPDIAVGVGSNPIRHACSFS